MDRLFDSLDHIKQMYISDSNFIGLLEELIKNMSGIDLIVNSASYVYYHEAAAW